MHTGILDTYFKATNFEEEDQDGNDDNALVRFEFLEIIVRIAQCKFIEYGTMTDLAEATEKLIVEHILPMQSSQLIEWQGFRDK